MIGRIFSAIFSASLPAAFQNKSASNKKRIFTLTIDVESDLFHGNFDAFNLLYLFVVRHVLDMLSHFLVLHDGFFSSDIPLCQSNDLVAKRSRDFLKSLFPCLSVS